MARLVLVLSIVGLMLADPVLCRAEARALPCSGTCRAWHQASASHSEPTAPGHDSAHGCLCQGATRNSGERFAPRIKAGTFDLNPHPRGVRPAYLWTSTRERREEGISSWTQGRSIRIEMQSFLI